MPPLPVWSDPRYFRFFRGARRVLADLRREAQAPHARSLAAMHARLIVLACWSETGPDGHLRSGCTVGDLPAVICRHELVLPVVPSHEAASC